MGNTSTTPSVGPAPTHPSNPPVRRFIRPDNGKVGVIISPDYSCGWSGRFRTFNDLDQGRSRNPNDLQFPTPMCRRPPRSEEEAATRTPEAMRAALRKEELAIFDRDIIAALLAKDKKKVAEVMVEKGIWDSDEEVQRKIAAMSALGRMVPSEQGKTVEEKVEEFMRDATVVWVDKGVQFKIQEYDGSEFIRFREDSHYWRA